MLCPSGIWLRNHCERLVGAFRIIKTSLGGPTQQEFEHVLAERDELRKTVDDLQAQLQQLKVSVFHSNAERLLLSLNARCAADGEHGAGTS